MREARWIIKKGTCALYVVLGDSFDDLGWCELTERNKKNLLVMNSYADAVAVLNSLGEIDFEDAKIKLYAPTK